MKLLFDPKVENFSTKFSFHFFLFFFLNLLSFLDRAIRSVVEQHLFDVTPSGDQSSEDCYLTPCPPSPSVTPTARQRRRQQREQREEELKHKERNRYTEFNTIMMMVVDSTSMKYQHEAFCLRSRNTKKQFYNLVCHRFIFVLYLCPLNLIFIK